jgi:hypothetical protein
LKLILSVWNFEKSSVDKVTYRANSLHFVYKDFLDSIQSTNGELSALFFA